MLHFVALLTLFQPVNLPHLNTDQSSFSGALKSYGRSRQERYPLHPVPIRPGVINLAGHYPTAVAVPRPKEQHHEPITTSNSIACP